jgi:microcystin degradation protein MlrC
MRVAIAGMLHESNTFLSIPTTIDRFKESSLLEGAAIAPAWRDAPHEWAGFLEGLEKEHIEAVPLIVAHAMPSGALTPDCFDYIAGRMTTLLQAALPVDGVLLGLHGATVAANHPDADGEVIARVRAIVGPKTPIIVTLDCHANVSRRMFEQADMLVIYRTCPHLDQKQRGLEAAELMGKILRREIRPVGHMETPPMCINITRQHTDKEPAVRIRQDLAAALERPGIVAGSFALGFPYANVPEMGMAFIAYADGNAAAAKEAAVWMAERAWDNRDRYLVDAVEPGEAVRIGAASPRRPVVLNDIGDNVGGGSAADSTFLLHEAYRQNARGMAVILYDPAAMKACIAAGVGAEVSLEVGGKSDNLHGTPVPVTGRVRIVTDGRFEEPEARHMGLKHFDQGTTAVIETPEGHSIMLTTYRQAPSSLHQLLHAGILPEMHQMIVAKGVILPQPAYDPVAARTILVNTPGSTTARIEELPWTKRRASMFPFEREARYQAGTGADDVSR